MNIVAEVAKTSGTPTNSNVREHRGGTLEFNKRHMWFAIVALLAAIGLFLVSGFDGLAALGLGLTVVGLIDFLFGQWTLDGYITSEVYGEPGEELWQFRSFVMMVGGPLLILYSVIF